MKKILLFLISMILIQYLFYKFIENNNKKFFCKEEYSGYYLSYCINGIYLTTNAITHPDHTHITLHKEEFKQSSLFPYPEFVRNYIMIDKEIEKKFLDDIRLKSPMDYFIISNIDFDRNIEVLFYNKNHPNIILEITPKGCVQLEKNILTKGALNIIAFLAPYCDKVFSIFLK